MDWTIGREHLPENCELTVGAAWIDHDRDGSVERVSTRASRIPGGVLVFHESPLDPIIRVDDIAHTYLPDSPEPIQALQAVSLTILPGEYVAVIGHNGSGKSTLARHLNGLLLPTRGDVWVRDWNTRDAAHLRDIRSTVGMVFQTPDNQIVATIVEEDVAFGPENLGVPRPALRERVDWAFNSVEMQSFRHRAPHLLSGGQKQRVAIAGILAMKPAVLVLDESTALLDPLGRAEVLRIARRLNQEGVTIVAITHFMHEATLADRVIVMEGGKIAMQGTPQQVFAQAERLHALQLDVPEITQLSQRLHAKVSEFPDQALTVNDFVDRFPVRRAPYSPNAHITEVAPAPAAIETLHSATGANTEAPSQSAAPAISIHGLTYTFLRGTPLESPALCGVDLEVRRGEIVGIIGHTGSGKSTLIQHLNGLVRPQAGTVHVLDYDLANPKTNLRALRQRVGLVFQFPEAQLFERYVGDDVAFGPWQMGIRGKELKDRVAGAMDAVGLAFSTFKDRPIFSLSGGERRRAALAGVLAIGPEILVLDEPTAGLDPRGHQDILARLVALHQARAMTLVMISHNMEEIARLCDRVYVLAGGRTVASGTPRQIFSQPERLAEYGLALPEVTAAMYALQQSGVSVRGDVLTVDEAETEVLKVLDGRV